GQQPMGLTYENQAARQASIAWKKAWAGVEPTASSLDSGLSTPSGKRPQGELRLIDVETNRHKVIASGDIVFPYLSPDKKHIAFYRFVSDFGLNRERTRSIDLRWRGYSLVVAKINGEIILSEIPEVEEFTPNRYPIFWSPDGLELAVIGRPRGGAIDF